MKKIILSLLFVPVLLFSQVKITSNVKIRSSSGKLLQERIIYQNCKVNWSRSDWNTGSALFLYEAPSRKFVKVDFPVEGLSCGVSIFWNTKNESQKVSEDESQEYTFIKNVEIELKYGKYLFSSIGNIYDYSSGDYKYYVVSFINQYHKEAIFIINLTKF